MFLIGLTAVKALAASPEKVEVAGPEMATQAAEMSFFDFLGAMVADDDGWIDPLDLDGPAGRELDANERKAPSAEASVAEELPILEEQP